MPNLVIVNPSGRRAVHTMGIAATDQDRDRPKRPDQRQEEGAVHPGREGTVKAQARHLVGESFPGSGRRSCLIPYLARECLAFAEGAKWSLSQLKDTPHTNSKYFYPKNVAVVRAGFHRG